MLLKSYHVLDISSIRIEGGNTLLRHSIRLRGMISSVVKVLAVVLLSLPSQNQREDGVSDQFEVLMPW